MGTVRIVVSELETNPSYRNGDSTEENSEIVPVSMRCVD